MGSFGRLGTGFGRLGVNGRHATVSYSAEALAVFAAMTTPPTDARKLLIDACIAALKTGGVWTLLDVLYVFAAPDTQSALLNWKNPGTNNAVETVAPTHVADRGYTSNGTTQYLTSYNPSTAGLQFVRDDNHLGCYVLTNGAATGSDVGSQNVRSRIRNRSGSSGFIVTSSGTTTATPADGVNVPAHLVGIRRDSANQFAFRNGLQASTAAVASTGTTDIIEICRAFASYSDRQIALVHAGKSLSDPQALAAYNAFNTYLQAVGAV